MGEGCIDVDRGNTVFQIVSTLPSGHIWKRYIQSNSNACIDLPDVEQSTVEEPVDLYLLVMVGDVDPTMEGPFQDDSARLDAARLYRQQQSDDDGLYRLTVPKGVTPIVDCFTGGEIGGYDLSPSIAD